MLCITSITIAAFLSSPAIGGSGDLTEETFHSLHKQLQPSLSEPWRTIPWNTSLLGAQREAAKTRKPLFIWAMDGHPLGCT